MAKVSIKLRVRMPDGRRVYAEPVWAARGRLNPLFARIKGTAQHFPDGIYYLRCGAGWQKVGQQIDEVMAAKMRLEQAPAAVQPVKINHSGPTILESLEAYLTNKATMDPRVGKEALHPHTIAAIRTTVARFQHHSGRVYLREVTGDDLVGYFAMLRTTAKLDPNAADYTQRLREVNNTVHGHYARLRTFFRKHRIDLTKLLEDDQIPHYKDREPDAYSREELGRMLAVATPEQRIRLQFFVASGFRKQELAWLTWDDIDLWTGMAEVNAKQGWKPKTKQRRSVALPDWLVAYLRARRGKAGPAATWVFPSDTGIPARHQQLLVMLKSVAKRAGITGRIDLHKFRSTYASLLNESGDVTVQEIAGRLGHTNITTTKAYLDRLSQNTDRAHKQSNDVFANLA